MTKVKTGGHIDILDGLRGWAIIMVLLFHSWQLSWFDYRFHFGGIKINLEFIPVTGFLGVELFFFISAFCLFYPYAKCTIGGGEPQTLRRFFYKRAIKIIPSYLLAMVLIQIFFQSDAISLGKFLWDNISHLLFIHNLFPATYGSINGVFWSLAVEVQFYMVFPLLCSLFRRKPKSTFAAMLAAAVLYRWYITVCHYDRFEFLLNQMPSFLDIFACGMMAAYIVVYFKEKLKEIERLGIFFTLIAVASLVLYNLMLLWLYDIRYESNGVQNWQAANRSYMSLLFLILTVSSCYSLQLWKSVMANKVMVFFSTISYNLYIWHQLLEQKMIKLHIPGYSTLDPHNDNVWKPRFLMLSTLTAIIFSAFITYLFERPLLKNGIKGTAFRLINITAKKTSVSEQGKS